MSILRGPALGLLVLAVAPTSGIALDDATKPKLCEPGHVIARQTPPGGFDFGTTSWWRPVRNAFSYSACIQNNEKQRELYVDWHIPTVWGVIVPADSIVKPRVFPTHQTDTINGCLIYGNGRNVMKVEFFGDHGEAAQAATEGDCSQLRARKTASLGPSEGFPEIVENGRMTFPSDVNDIEHSLVRMTYEIGLSARNNETYGMVFNYAAAPATPDNFSGSIKDLTIRPSDDRLGEAWKNYGPSGPLKETSGHFVIPQALPKTFELAQQSYIIYGKGNAVVGEIPAPFLSAIRQ